MPPPKVPDRAPVSQRRLYALRVGTSLADSGRHAIVREGLVDALLLDPRVAPSVERWSSSLASWIAKDPDGERSAFWRKAAERFADEAVSLVMGLHGPVSWTRMLALDLAEAALHTAAVPGRRLKPRPLVPDLFAPPVSMQSEPVAGESLREAEDRLSRAYVIARLQLEASEATAGRATAPPRGGEHLRRWGRWLYEIKLREPARTVSDIARELHGTRKHSKEQQTLLSCGCRNDVRDALREAERLMDLAADAKIPHWPPGGNETAE